jgi:uncharacterized protein (TIGR03437 family)
MLLSEFHYDEFMHRLIFWLLSGLVVSAQTTPKVTGVLNGASFGSHLSPGTLASLFGSNLATATRSADSIPLPTDIMGTKVLVQDPSMPGPIAASIYFVSLGQINFQIPFEVVRSSVTITVSTAQGSSDPVKVNLDAVAPAIFSQTANGIGDALVFDAGFKLLTRTPDTGSTVILYATGLGATTPPAQSGNGGGAAPFNVVAAPFDVYIGGTKATVAWAGLAPGFVGVYQVNVVPKAPAIGDIVISCDCPSESNHVHMPQAPVNSGNNTTNATGSVSIIYPAGQPTITFSPGFLVAKITARFDTKPSADKFTLSAVAKIGTTTVDGTTIQFDPVLKQFTATIPAPSPAVRSYDFSTLYSAGLTAIDFLCQPPKGCPMPGNIVPLSRIDLQLVAALKTVPVLNTPPNGIHSFYTVIGKFTPGSTFIMDSANNVDFLVFASFGSVPFPTADVPVSVTLYIDGQIIDAATAMYKHP